MVHRIRVAAVAAALLGLSALVTSPHLHHAQLPLDELRTLADQGNADAQYNLGVRYLNGTGVNPNTDEAVRWWRLAAGQGDAFAQYNLGYVYDTGQGIEPDLLQAAKWYRLAADQGDADAQDALGFMYLNGRGVAQDHAEAVRLSGPPAAQGLVGPWRVLGARRLPPEDAGNAVAGPGRSQIPPSWAAALPAKSATSVRAPARPRTLFPDAPSRARPVVCVWGAPIRLFRARRRRRGAVN